MAHDPWAGRQPALRACRRTTASPTPQPALHHLVFLGVLERIHGHLGAPGDRSASGQQRRANTAGRTKGARPPCSGAHHCCLASESSIGPGLLSTRTAVCEATIGAARVGSCMCSGMLEVIGWCWGEVQ